MHDATDGISAFPDSHVETTTKAAYDQLGIAVRQGVETEFWNEVDMHSSKAPVHFTTALPLSEVIDMIKDDSLDHRGSSGEIGMRQECVRVALNFLQEDVLRFIEVCMANTHVRDAISLRILPDDIVEQYGKSTRELLLRKIFSEPMQHWSASLHPQMDGGTIFTTMGTAPLDPSRWNQAADILMFAQGPITEAKLIADEARDAMNAILETLSEQMHEQKELWNQATTLRGMPYDEQAEHAAHTVFEIQAINWVNHLRTGWRRDKLRQFLR